MRLHSFLPLLLLTSCTTATVQMNQNQLRDVMMNYTEDQIVDNVIRAKTCMPILHVDMESVDALVKTNVSASTGRGRAENSSRSRSASVNQGFSVQLN